MKSHKSVMPPYSVFLFFQEICVAVLDIGPLSTAAGLSVRYKAPLCREYKLYHSVFATL